jgi:hypothetical protein
MQLKLFIVPVKNLETPEREMNSFLRSHRVLAVRKEFASDRVPAMRKELVSDRENSFWTFCVEYLENTTFGNAAPGCEPSRRRAAKDFADSPHSSRLRPADTTGNQPATNWLEPRKTKIISHGRSHEKPATDSTVRSGVGRPRSLSWRPSCRI